MKIKYSKDIISLFKLSMLLVFLILGSGIALANSEKCVVHLDKSFYVTGEIMWYKIYLPTAFKDKSLTIRATLLDKSGDLQHSSFLKTAGKTYAQGYYSIPYEQTSGMYLLRFSCINQAKKELVTLVDAVIPIYNDLEARAVNVANTKSVKQVTSSHQIPNELDISISLPKNIIKAREQVQPQILVKDKQGKTVAANLSISVTDAELVKRTIVGNSSLQSGLTLDNRLIDVFNNKIYIKGWTKNAEGNPHSARILGAYNANRDAIIYTKSNEEGAFFLAVEDFYGEQNFQFLGDPNEYEKIKAINQNSFDIESLPILPSNPAIDKYLQLSRQRKKIFQFYTMLESKLELASYQENKKPIRPDASFISKEYEDFEFMSIFFKENLTPLRFQFQDQDSTYIAKMYNPKNDSQYDKFFRTKPLIIVDGLATRNGDFLARMRMSDVEKVELLYDLKKLNKQYKIFGSGGVTKVTTYDKIESLPVFEANNTITINGIQKAANFPVFDPSSINNNRFQPFFRPQLYWNPLLEVKKDGSGTFSFFQSDDRSTFIIRVVAQSEDGSIGYKEIEYEVR